MEKKRLMQAVDKILNAKKETIDILRHNAVCQLRSIERNSKSLKDPDPLSSTMARICTKYPITINTKEAKRLNIPNEYYLNVSDTRKHGRSPCKIETVFFWIENQPELTEKEKENIRKLMTITKIKFDTYKKIDWNNIEFVVGKIMYDRRKVSTNPLAMEIPHDLKIPAIAKALNLTNFIDYNEIPQYFVEKIKEIIDSSALHFYSLPNIIQYILSSLDQRNRFLPSIGNYSEEFYLLSHVLIQPYYRVRSIGGFSLTSSNRNLTITNFCKTLLFLRRVNRQFNVLQCIERSTLHEYPIIRLIDQSIENKFIKSIKGLIGREISSQVNIRNYDFHPEPIKLGIMEKTNKSGFKFREYLGKEKVYFQKSDGSIKGYFIHDGDLLNQMFISFCSLNDLISALASIGLFCKKGFESSVGKTSKSVTTNLYNHWTSNYNEIVNTTKLSIQNALNEISSGKSPESKAGLLVIGTVSDFIIPRPEKVILFENELVTEGGQIFCTIPTIYKPIILDESINSTDEKIFKYLGPIRLLEKAIMKNMHFRSLILDNIKNNIWTPFLSEIQTYIPERFLNNLNFTCKRFCKEIIKSDNINKFDMVFNYIFTSGMEKKGELISSFKYTNTEFIRLDFSEGLVTKIDFGKSVLLNKKKIMDLSYIDELKPIYYVGLLPDFELKTIPINQRSNEISYKSLKWLQINSKKIPEGKLFYTNFKTNWMIAKKNSAFNIQIANTLERYSIMPHRPIETNELAQHLSSLKRKREDEENSTSGGSDEVARKLRIVEVSSNI